MPKCKTHNLNIGFKLYFQFKFKTRPSNSILYNNIILLVYYEIEPYSIPGNAFLTEVVMRKHCKIIFPT